jgi:two-component system, OmpR family, alkaline phosphatase synthesis response regulator PhoP
MNLLALLYRRYLCAMQPISNYRILLVEDEESLSAMIKLNLEIEGYVVVLANTGIQALDKAHNQAFDLIILDVMLPELDGFAVCEKLKLEGNTTPILILSAKGSGKDKVEGLKLGADDYMAKPFELEELVLRIQKLISRKDDHVRSLADLDEYRFGANYVNFRTFLIQDKTGCVQELSRKEMMLLKLLILKNGMVVSREEILEKVWGYDIFPNSRTIDNFILVFRKHFEEDPKNPHFFHSVRGVGYRFENTHNQ